ncbi:hypothetical protein SADUNF_Sadunf16G0223700 [Salix dunnii]|uniref:Uncharacterized protein n=1 Tax=Salix dunnii TaxID=1413687 RepID=A0A835MH81_9ROSI|nr:hypothetical protein SADUNF_Sadunf16G0223700 [Salix dunnii]
MADLVLSFPCGNSHHYHDKGIETSHGGLVVVGMPDPFPSLPGESCALVEPCHACPGSYYGFYHGSNFYCDHPNLIPCQDSDCDCGLYHVHHHIPDHTCPQVSEALQH